MQHHINLPASRAPSARYTPPRKHRASPTTNLLARAITPRGCSLIKHAIKPRCRSSYGSYTSKRRPSHRINRPLQLVRLDKHDLLLAFARALYINWKIKVWANLFTSPRVRQCFSSGASKPAFLSYHNRAHQPNKSQS